MKVIGLMSGTSGDGIDAVLVDIRGHGEALKVKMLAHLARPYSRSLQQRILEASLKGTVGDVCHLNALLGELFAQAALRVTARAGFEPSDVALIGSHGQTIHHLPAGTRETGVGLIRSTLQIAEPAVIAERTGIMTIAGFRPRDMAAGGEGAPLAPYAHYVLLSHPRRSRLIVNLGGISNVTYLPKGGKRDDAAAFDTGPANMVLDALMQRLSEGRMPFDRGGKQAAKGTIHRELLAELMAHPFLKRRPPKSTGREEFGEHFTEQLLARQRAYRLRSEDLLATCAYWTAAAVGSARRWLREGIDEVVVGGGGVYNETVMRHLRTVFRNASVRTFDDVGWKSKAFEAIAFAVLAYQTVCGRPANLPRVTGARHPVLLGVIVPGGVRRTGRRPSVLKSAPK
jgi:anhydro-N-acetylmuramic acid kinase